MQRRSLARWLVVGALAVFGLGFVANVAFAQGAEVAGQNAADDGTAETGAVTGANSSTFGNGPTATASDDAAAQQLGQNTADIKQSGTGKSGDPVAGGQITGSVGNATVQNQNNASGNTALSGNVDVSNSADVALGPFASSDFGEAQAQQTGDNELAVSQAVTGESGDAVAGSQITGIAAASEGLVQNQNIAEDNFAESGFVFAENFLTATLGPVATTFGPPAQASQVGDNDATIEQATSAASGDGVAGSQVTGAVGSSDFTVQNQNNSEFNTGISGEADAFSTAFATLGPVATAIDPFAESAEAQASQTGDNQIVADQASGATTGDALAGSQVTGLVSSESGQLEVQNQQTSDTDEAFSGFATAVTFLDAELGPQAFAASGIVEDFTGIDFIVIDVVGGESEAQASQVGDNTADVTHTADASTGDAVAGGQITGAVSGDGSEITIQNQNSSDFAFAQSGDADAENPTFITAGPQADAITGVTVDLGSAFVADAAFCVGAGCLALSDPSVTIIADVTGGDAEAQASQTGDNTVAISETAAAESGDAVAGAQVTGAVAGDDSDVIVQNQNNADFPEAIGGSVLADNTAVVEAGPVADATAGIALVADNNFVSASAACFGAGCTAQATPSVLIDVSVSDVSAEAQASQIGDNAADVAQAIDAASGDVVSGSQVTGVVAGDDSTITIQNQNTSEEAVADNPLDPVIGHVDVFNDASISLGPDANADAGASVDVGSNFIVANAFCDGDGCTAIADPLLEIAADVSGATAEAQASQTGDNDAALAQAIAVDAGDAVAGSQVTGAVAGDDSEITISEQNSSDFAFAESGEVIADNFATVVTGPNADAVTGTSLTADNNAVFATANCFGADCVATTDVFIDPTITIAVDVTGGDAEAQASQTGDNTTDVAQAVDVAGGDAVAGSQVAGAVAGDDSEITISSQNSSEFAEAFSDDVLASNFADVVQGPTADAVSGADLSVSSNFANAVAGCTGDRCDASALAAIVIDATVDGGDAEAQASQIGDNTAAVAQAIDAESGDAVAGSQVTGAVAGDDSEITISGQNTSEFDFADSGDVVVDNFASVEAGPVADAITGASLVANNNFVVTDADCVGVGCTATAVSTIDIFVDASGGDAEAQASQTGDNAADVAQSIDAATGDAVAGSQVTGAVSGDGSVTTIQNQNSAEEPFAESGDVFADNDPFVDLGPAAFADTAVSIEALDNVAVADAFCIGDGCFAFAGAFTLTDTFVDGGDAEAQAAQTGDNTADVAQDIDASSGDALAGSQVTGVVTVDGDVTVNEQNNSELSFAQSGDVFAENDAEVNLGPVAETDTSADIFASGGVFVFTGCIGVGCVADADASSDFFFEFEDGTTEAQASQIGDNAATVDQSADVASGDAVSGSQVVGIVGADDSDVLIQNLDEFSEAFSGFTDAANAVFGNLGPFADSPFGEAQSSHDGDSSGDADQGFTSETGDALTGSQISGVVG